MRDAGGGRRDEPFLVAGMRYGRKFDGGMRDRKGSEGGGKLVIFITKTGWGNYCGKWDVRYELPCFTHLPKIHKTDTCR